MRVKPQGRLWLSITGICVAAPALALNHGIRINETLISHTGADDTEFVELFGLPGSSLDGLSLIAIEGEGSNAGILDERVDFSAEQKIGANGRFLIGNQDGLSANYGKTPNLALDLNLENGDQTLALVETSSLTVSVGSRISGEEAVIDSLGLTGSGDVSLPLNPPTVGPDGRFFPAGARRKIDGEDTDTAADWLLADFFLGSDNTPEPGFSVVINDLLASHSGSDDTEFAELSGTPGAILDGLSLIVVEGDSGQSGMIDRRIDLGAGDALGSNGFFLIGNPEGLAREAGITPDLEINDNFFENSSLTVALAQTASLSGDSVTGDEIIVDAVGLNDGDPGDVFFFNAPVVGPDGNFFPAGVTRNSAGTDTDTAQDFALNSFSLDGSQTPQSAGTGDDGGDAPIATQCGDPATLISSIQGTGDVSPLEGEVHTLEALVTGAFQSQQTGLKGFFLQEETDDQDGNPASSEGVFVFDNGFGVNVSVGQTVRVTGQVEEFRGETEIAQVNNVHLCDAPLQTPEPVSLSLPESTDGELERYEGMLVALQHPMTVAQTFFLGRYGQMTLSSPNDQGQIGRLIKPTNIFLPGSPEAEALADENARRLLVLDDGMDINPFGDNPEPVPYLGAPPPRPLRAGDRVEQLVGVLDFGRINSAPPGQETNGYRLHPVQEPVFVTANPRTEAPLAIDGELKVASFNVLNYFNGDGLGGGFPTPRGADTPEELERQEAKLVRAIRTLDAAVYGLMEIENDGYSTASAIAELVAALNADAGEVVYAFADPGTVEWGTDAIAVGMIYRQDRVRLAPGTTIAGLESGEFVQGSEQRHRKPMAATFEQLTDGEQFTVVVNHFKSKGSLTGIPGDEAQGDGQGRNNLSRTRASEALLTWLDTRPTGTDDPDTMIIGDLNSYGMEDPIRTLTDGGFINLIGEVLGDESYSFIFDGESGTLDHALANSGLTQQVAGITQWPINADEPAVIDFDQDFNPAGYFDGSTPFRASDHDPILVGLTLGAATLPGDLNGDGQLDFGDYQVMIGAFGSQGGDAAFVPEADLDGDGRITFVDFQSWYQLFINQ